MRIIASLAAAALVLGAAAPAHAAEGIHKIKHVVVIMQENRSFDSYFGTFPGANGIPMKDGQPTVCVPDPQLGGCQRPYVDHHNDSGAGPHGGPDAKVDVDGGKMDGFLTAVAHGQFGCSDPDNP